MSPRQYNLGKRHKQIDQGRRQILDAACALLGETTTYTEFTVDAVAKRADVVRGTVYYQFGSKTGLLEAICDDLAQRGDLAQLHQAFANPDPDQALNAFVTCFARFWQADRNVMRRLRALASLDSDVRTVISVRDQRRQEGLEELASRFAARNPVTARRGLHRTTAVRLLLALTSFETFDASATPDQDLAAVVPHIVALVTTILDPSYAVRLLGSTKLD
jgi:AcrR family transcriptional regulator